MKQLKTLSKLLALFLVLTFTNCQKDDKLIEEGMTTESRFKIKLVPKVEYNHITQITEKLESVNSKLGSLQNRTETEDAFNFTILTEYSKYVEATDGSIHSYTFKIERDEPSELVENIVFTSDGNGNYQSSIVTYHFPDFDTIGINYENIDFDADTVLNDIQQRNCISWYTCEQWIFYCPDCTNAPNEGYYECAMAVPHTVCSQDPIIDYGDSGGAGTSTGNEPQYNDGNQWDDTVWYTGGPTDGGVVSSPTSDCNSIGQSGFSGSGGCGTTVNDILIDNLVSIIEQPLGYETTASYRERLSAVGEYFTVVSHTDFVGLNEMLTDSITNINLSLDDLRLMWEKTKEAYDILKPYALQLANLDSLDDMSVVVPPAELVIAETNLTIVAFLPQVKSLVGQNWPQSIAQWEALGSILFQPQFLLEIGLGFIPGSSIIDVISGINEGDYLAVTFGVAGLIIDAFGGTIIKAIGKIGKVAWKSFKIFKVVFKYLNEIKNSISLGFKTLLDGNTVRILDDTDILVAKVVNNILTFNYTGFGGDIITNPN